MIKLIVGLGNPGPDYVGTRHNFGFMAVDAYAKAHHLRFRLGRFGYLAEGPGYWLLKPTTFMNLSGDAVAPFVKKHHLDPAELLVVVDDLDLPLGHLRIRAKGSSGGHNGLKSVIAALGTEQFARLRLGISRPPEGTSVLEWVLSRFAWEERRLVAGVLERAVKAVEVAIADGIEIAMTQFNG